jgi:hypothetical protein
MRHVRGTGKVNYSPDTISPGTQSSQQSTAIASTDKVRLALKSGDIVYPWRVPVYMQKRAIITYNYSCVYCRYFIYLCAHRLPP